MENFQYNMWNEGKVHYSVSVFRSKTKTCPNMQAISSLDRCLLFCFFLLMLIKPRVNIA